MFAAIIAALKAVALNAAQSIGASLAIGFSALAAGFLPAEKQILVDAKTEFYNTYDAQKTAGASELDAIENSATAALNKFGSEEGAFMVQEVRATITLLVSSLKSAAGLKDATTA
jgi:hypothetical protein